MSTPIVPSHKIKGKHKLDNFIRDTYAGYTNTVTVPLKTTTEELHKKPSVNITHEKHIGKQDDYYRFYYYKTYTQKKPGRFFAASHPVFMQRKCKGDK